MKKKKVVILISIVVLICASLGIYSYIENNKDSVIFKKEYEEYNNKKWEYGKVKGIYHEINIDKNNPVVYLTDDNIVKELTSGTKIIFFSFPDCNWCRTAIPVLLKAAKDDGIEAIYYYNPKIVRAAYEEGKNNKQSKTYEQIVNAMEKYIETTFDDGPNKNKKKLTVPTVVLVKKGEVTKYYNGTVKSHTNYNKKLTKKEYNKLYDIYEKMMTDLILCSADC